MQSVKERNRDRLTEFLKSNGKVDFYRAEALMDLADNTDFLVAPASTRYHGNYPGGLFDHSLEVAKLLVSWTDLGLIPWKRKRSPVLVGLLHDLTKVGKYTPDPNSEGPDGVPSYHYTPISHRSDFGGHGSDSCIKALQLMSLTEEELSCSRWHMGAYEKDSWELLDAAVRKFPSVLWVHHADMVASKCIGV